MPVSIITSCGKEIIYVDHKGLSGDALLQNYKEALRVIKQKGKGSLLLADFRDASISSEVQEFVKTQENKDAVSLLSKQAGIGISGIKKIVYNLYCLLTKSELKLFDNIEDAKLYLVS